MKICFAASSGGHFEQLMMLQPYLSNHDNFIVTERTSYDINANNTRVYKVLQVNRKEKRMILKFMVISVQSFMIFVKEKPDLVMSTGSLSTIPILLIAKIFRKKIIFIESFAKIHSPTLTGKLVYRFADLFIIQWEELRKHYPNAVFKGESIDIHHIRIPKISV
ncbi:PssD/Cps14F family polysaccharide biosynthesis glycosyltransferase [Planococcus koreensis]|uniref:PssD/Cps14F family polysaccharide biosynthesis glycosyltransferase n=1 Tax=Planococcus koreensis TaxID=112331 RepID=UPI0039FC5962